MRPTGLDLYDAAASAGAGTVIRRYSTSFGLASRLLSRRIRPRIADLYALVRVADEIVDGPAEQAGLDPLQRRVELDELERRTERALEAGFSGDLIVHAFAHTAREHGIGVDLTRPFFASMRTDLHRREFSPEQARDYVYGSAEVIGLMCLRVFEAGRRRTAEQERILADGARALGRAFQRVNFLRDWAADTGQLHRLYLPEASAGLDGPARDAVVASIREDLAEADAAIPLLDPGARPAVQAARDLFGELTDRLARTDPQRLRRDRIRVPAPRKAALLVRAAIRRSRA